MRDQVDQARWFAVLPVTAIALCLCVLMLRGLLQTFQPRMHTTDS